MKFSRLRFNPKGFNFNQIDFTIFEWWRNGRKYFPHMFQSEEYVYWEERILEETEGERGQISLKDKNIPRHTTTMS